MENAWCSKSHWTWISVLAETGKTCGSGIVLTHFSALPESGISIWFKWFGSQSETENIPFHYCVKAMSKLMEDTEQSA